MFYQDKVDSTLPSLLEQRVLTLSRTYPYLIGRGVSFKSQEVEQIAKKWNGNGNNRVVTN